MKGAGQLQVAASVSSWTDHRQRVLMLGVFPALVVLGVITLAPALFLVLTSLTPLNLTRPEQTAWNFSEPWINYLEMFQDEYFINSVLVQVRLSFYSVGLQLLIGLGLALLLNIRARFLEALRTTFLVPMVLPPIVVAIIWKVLYTPDISPIHWALEKLFGFQLDPMITSPDYALWAIIIADVWQWFPFTMLMLLAALQMLPEEPLEAARIDGANARQLFWYVILPLLRPTLLVAGLFRLIDSIKAFPLIYVLTGGGPGSVTEVTNYYAFVRAFSFSMLGYSSAITVVMVVAVFLLAWLVIRMFGMEVETE